MCVCRCNRVTDRGFESVARGCAQLVELRMYACAALTDRTLASVGRHLGQLQLLDCCGANAITGVRWADVHAGSALAARPPCSDSGDGCR